jgi:hypothetical protein
VVHQARLVLLLLVFWLPTHLQWMLPQEQCCLLILDFIIFVFLVLGSRFSVLSIHCLCSFYFLRCLGPFLNDELFFAFSNHLIVCSSFLPFSLRGGFCIPLHQSLIVTAFYCSVRKGDYFSQNRLCMFFRHKVQ